MLTRANKNDDYIRHVLNHLRIDDEIEMYSEYGKHWKVIVEETAQRYDLKIAIDDNKKPVCMFGVVPQENNIGVVWLLSTNELTKKENYITFLREARKEIAVWLKEYSLICNKVHKKNHSTINWLKWLGFRFDNPLGLDERVSLFFYKGNLKNDKNRKTTDNRTLQGIKGTPLIICSKMERYSKLRCNNK